MTPGPDFDKHDLSALREAVYRAEMVAIMNPLIAKFAEIVRKDRETEGEEFVAAMMEAASRIAQVGFDLGVTTRKEKAP